MLYQGLRQSCRTVHRRRREEGRFNTIWREQSSGHDHQPNTPEAHAATS